MSYVGKKCECVHGLVSIWTDDLSVTFFYFYHFLHLNLIKYSQSQLYTHSFVHSPRPFGKGLASLWMIYTKTKLFNG